MWASRRLTTLRASTACYRDSLARKADNLTAICDCLENVGASTSHNPTGLHGLLQVELYQTCLCVTSSTVLPRNITLWNHTAILPRNCTRLRRLLALNSLQQNYFLMWFDSLKQHRIQFTAAEGEPLCSTPLQFRIKYDTC
jgi:hypothetical protein